MWTLRYIRSREALSLTTEELIKLYPEIDIEFLRLAGCSQITVKDKRKGMVVITGGL